MSENVETTGITPEMGAECAKVQQRHFSELETMFGTVGAMGQFMAYGVDAGKHMGLSREKFLEVMGRLWDAAEVAAEMVKSGRAAGPDWYTRLTRVVKGERVLEAVPEDTDQSRESED